MANFLLLAPLSMFLIIFTRFPFLATALSTCGGSCQTLNDCRGQLICIKGKCDDDPDIGTHICSGSSGCPQYGTLNCNGTFYPTYNCSPKVSSSTHAILININFSKGGDRGGPSECDGHYHDNSELIVALSTGWFAGGSLCGQWIQITAKNVTSVRAKVVDECDSMNGCDTEHAGQPPCRNNIVGASDAVWVALGLDADVGEVQIVTFIIKNV